MYPPVMWQHMQEVAGFLISSLLQIYQGIFQWKKIKAVKIWRRWLCGLTIFGSPCIDALKRIGNIFLQSIEKQNIT